MNNGYDINGQKEFQFDGVSDNLILQHSSIETSSISGWPRADMRALEEFCKKHNIPRFHCGMMSPTAALAYLKNEMGIVDGPSENKNQYGPNSSYQSFIQKKNILHG
jgi:hypothetical protein